MKILRRIAVVVALLPLANGAARAAPPERPVLVVSPLLAGPEDQLFRQLRQSARAALTGAGIASTELTIADGATPAAFPAELAALNPRAVLVLGRRALGAVAAANYTGPLFIGGVDLPVGAIEPRRAAIGLFPEPARVLARLKITMPAVRRVVVVASAERLAEIRAPLASAAHSAGLQAVLHEAAGLGEGAALLLNVLRFGNPETDAVWIVENSDTFTADVLPRVVELAWANHFVVISNYVDHVSKGALFAPFPDPQALGTTLGRLASTGRATGRVEFLRELEFAANLRTARHLVPVVRVESVTQADVVLGQR